MSCSNCYNGCPEITSDQCVKYTGVDVPVLGIQKGDSLSYVEQAIITFLTSTLDGSGIKVDIDQNIICEIVQKYLPTCGDLTVIDFLKALTQAVCELKTLVDGTIADVEDINDFIETLEGTYNVGDCLEDVTSTSGTHDILQAVIDRLCAFITLDVPGTYVKIDDLDVLIGNYISNQPAASKFYTRMVPFVAVPFFPTPEILSNFSGSGVGSGDWENIYFCNGLNGTPDMRGRVPVGLTNGNMGGSTLSPVVNPSASPLNPVYALSAPIGSNSTTLITSQIPSHTHTATATSTVVEPNSGQGHRHDFVGVDTVNTAGGSSSSRFCGNFTKQTSYATTGITVNTTVTNASTGGNEAHSNVQPGIGCYYIMYIP